MEERIEFIDQKKEQKEIKKGFLKELLDGSLLTREVVVKQLPFIIFVTFLAVLYIGNRYHAEKVVRNTTELQNEIKELRAESISIAAELMDISRQSEVARLVDKKGLGLKESMEPPKKIYLEE
jgi:cell division protein FtsL